MVPMLAGDEFEQHNRDTSRRALTSGSNSQLTCVLASSICHLQNLGFQRQDATRERMVLPIRRIEFRMTMNYRAKFNSASSGRSVTNSSGL